MKNVSVFTFLFMAKNCYVVVWLLFVSHFVEELESSPTKIKIESYRNETFVLHALG